MKKPKYIKTRVRVILTGNERRSVIGYVSKRTDKLAATESQDWDGRGLYRVSSRKSGESCCFGINLPLDRAMEFRAALEPLADWDALTALREKFRP